MDADEARQILMRLRDAKLKELDALRNKLIGMEMAIVEFARTAGIEITQIPAGEPFPPSDPAA